jgi:hypothetical protein
MENLKIKILLQCYKKLCEYITDTRIYHKLATASTNGGASLVDLINEGAGYSFEKPKIKTSTPKIKKKGCRCGTTAKPGLLTCFGQRCPCYVEAKACVECRCRGCRNPHRPGGKKLRPHIPELHSIQIHLPTNAMDIMNRATNHQSSHQSPSHQSTESPSNSESESNNSDIDVDV